MTPAADRPVRFGLLGYGFGGRYFHAPLLADAPGCELVAIVTSADERRQQVAVEHPSVRAVAGFDELKALGVEAVAISTPADTHSALCDEALRRGFHVVCDKPFSLDAAAAQATLALAEKQGLLVAPYQNRRWDSDFLTVRSLLADGRLGEVTQFESRFERFAPDRGPGAAGAGTLRDFLSHLVDQALVLFGPVATVYADWRVRDSGLDDDVFVALRHQGGVRSRLWGSWTQGAPGPRFRVAGTEGAYVVDGPMDGQEPALKAGVRPGALGERWGQEPEHRWGQLRREGTIEVVPTVPGAWPTYYPAFATAVRRGTPVPVAPADAVATAEVLDAARLSATTGRSVDLWRTR